MKKLKGKSTKFRKETTLQTFLISELFLLFEVLKKKIKTQIQKTNISNHVKRVVVEIRINNIKNNLPKYANIH